MAGYIRQDTTNNIADGNIINAADFDAEYDAIEDAFDAATGHVHDGTVGNGAPITKIGPSQDVIVSINAVTPKTDNLIDLGSSLLEFKDLYIDGTANIDSLIADTADINGGTIDGVTIATSDITVGSGKTLNVSAGTLTLADNQISGDKVEGGTINAITINTLTSGTVDINGGAIDGTIIGGASAAAGSFTTLAASGNSTIGGTLGVTGLITATGGISGTVTSSNATVTGGSINGTTIGASTASTGAFTTLTSNSTTTLNGTTIPASVTLVSTAATQTLTNKTISADDNTISGIAASSFVLSNSSGNIDGAAAQKAIPSGVVVGTTDTQTLTNKTLTAPVIATIVNTGTLTLPTSTDTLVGRATTDTLTNKTISGSNNTLSNIANASLTNSSITVGSTNIALGATATTLAGLSSVTSTSFVGALTGNASTATALQTPRAINGVNFDGTAPITITAANPNALTIGTGLSGISYDGSSAVTIAIDSSVVTLSGTQTLTNKTIAFGSNTLTDVASTNTSQTLTNKTINGSNNTITNVSLTTAVTGILPIANGGTNASTAANARVSLGLVIGTDVQAFNAANAVTNAVQSFTAAQRGTVVALTDGATITPNFAAGNNFSVTLGGNRTLANPTNQTAGQSGVIVVTQDGTGGRVLSFGSNWKFPGGTAPVLTTAANSIDVLAYFVESSSRITARLVADVK